MLKSDAIHAKYISTLRSNLRYLRDSAGLSNAKLYCNLRATGNFVCQSTLDALSNGSAKAVKSLTLVRLCTYFRVPIDVMLLTDIQADKRTVEEIARKNATQRADTVSNY